MSPRVSGRNLAPRKQAVHLSAVLLFGCVMPDPGHLALPWLVSSLPSPWLQGPFGPPFIEPHLTAVGQRKDPVQAVAPVPWGSALWPVFTALTFRDKVEGLPLACMAVFSLWRLGALSPAPQVDCRTCPLSSVTSKHRPLGASPGRGAGTHSTLGLSSHLSFPSAVSSGNAVHRSFRCTDQTWRPAAPVCKGKIQPQDRAPHPVTQ